MPWGSDPIIGRAPPPKVSGGVKPLTASQQLNVVEEDRKKQEREQTSRQMASRIMSATEVALEKINRHSTGPMAFFTKNLPFTEAGSLKETIRGITSPIAIEQLNKMRQESPTGGALGNISDRDIITLQSIYGSLETAQKPEDLQRTLHEIQNVYSKILGIVPPHQAELLRSMGRTGQRLPGKAGEITAPLTPPASAPTMPVRQVPARSQGLTQEQVNQMYDEAINARSK